MSASPIKSGKGLCAWDHSLGKESYFSYSTTLQLEGYTHSKIVESEKWIAQEMNIIIFSLIMKEKGTIYSYIIVNILHELFKVLLP